MAVQDYFMKIDGIPGESQDSKHKNEIDVISYTFGMAQQGTSAQGGGSGAGRVKVHDMTIVKQIDVASPKLMEACATGTHIKTATFISRKAGKEQQENWQIALTDLLISAVTHSQPTDGSLTPLEQVSINFSTYEVTYKQQQADGTLAGPVKHKFDLKANKVG